MSNRTVAVVLKAQIADYQKNMLAAQKHTTDVEKAARTATQQLEKHHEALSRIGVGMTAVGAAAAVGIGLAVKAASEYGAKMAQLQSLSHASVGDMQKLSDAAMKQGTAFGFTATQVAEAEIELSKAGRSASDMLGGDLKGALALAAAGQMDVAKATEIGVTALTQFKATGATIPQTADALAAGADKALGSVEDLGMGLKQGGLVASQMGLTLQDTVGTLSAFAQAGLMGSDAGTSLKSMFLALQSPTKQSKELLEAYNITAYDTQGNFVGITTLAGELQRAFKGKSDAERDAAMSTIFGSDAIRAANILYTNGAQKMRGWIDSVTDTGFAAAQAAGKLNSLQGDVQKLSAAFQTDLIKAGTSAGSALRAPVQAATGLLGILGDAPPELQSVGMALGGVTAAVGLVGGVMLLTVPKIAAAKLALEELKLSGRGALGVFGKGSALVVGLTAAASGFAAMAQHGTASTQQISLAGTSIRKNWTGIDDLFAKAGNALNAGSGLKASLQELGNGDAGWTKWLDGAALGLTHFSDVYKSNEQTFDAMGQQLAGLAQQDYGASTQSFSELVRQFHLGGAEAKTLLENMPAYRDELIKVADGAHITASAHNLLLIAEGKGKVGAQALAYAQGEAAKSAGDQQAEIDRLAGTAVSASVDIKKLADTIAGFGSTTLDARAAQRDFRKAVEDARKAVHDSTASDDDKQAALDGIARAGIASAAALAKTPGGAAKARDAMKIARTDFIAVASAMLGSKTKAKELADQLGLIPGNVPVAVTLSGTAAAQTAIDRLRSSLLNIPDGEATIYVNAIANGVDPGRARQQAKNAVQNGGFADGGPIDGPGPKGVDSVYAILAPGEHVLTAREVDRMGGQAAVSAFRADLMGQVQHYATGGPVRLGPAPKAAPTPAKKTTSAAAVANAIDAQTRAAAQAQRDADTLTRRIASQHKKATAAAKAAEKAQKRADSISGDKKHQAEKKRAKDAATAAKKRADAAAKTEETLRTQRDDAKQKRDDATEAAKQLRNDREDFTSDETRNPNRRTDDPIAYVDQLRQMSRDSKLSVKDRHTLDDAANQYEAGLVKLGKDATDAAQKLTDLKDASKQMHDSVQQAIRGGYTLAGHASAIASADPTTQTSGWFQRDGIAYQQTTQTQQAVTASSIAGYYAAGAQTASTFADTLQQLAGRGLSSELLAELAGMGTEAGLPIAQAILAGSASDVASINASYGAIAAAGDRAGTTVADANYAAQIAAADANARQITDEITRQGEALRKIIAQAFGLKGYATGTLAATEGMHWVGETGPELVGLRAGTPVATAADSARWVRGGGASPAAPAPVIVQPAPVTFPDVLTVQDASGFELRMRVVARQEIAHDAQHDAVLMMGGASL